VRAARPCQLCIIARRWRGGTNRDNAVISRRHANSAGARGTALRQREEDRRPAEGSTAVLQAAVSSPAWLCSLRIGRTVCWQCSQRRAECRHQMFAAMSPLTGSAYSQPGEAMVHMPNEHQKGTSVGVRHILRFPPARYCFGTAASPETRRQGRRFALPAFSAYRYGGEVWQWCGMR